MNVTFLTPTLEFAGGTVVLQRYTDALIAAGHRVTIISPRRGQYFGKLSPRIVEYPALPVRYLDTLTFQLPYWNQIIRTIPAETDIIVPIYTPLLMPSYLFWRQHRNVKVILLAQESMEIPLIGSYNRFLLGRRSVTKCLSAVVTVSEKLKEQVERLVTHVPVKAIVNGVDHNIFRPRSVKKNNSILFVGRPNSTKGFPEFVNLITRLQGVMPGLRGQIVVPPHYRVRHPLLSHTPNRDTAQLAEFYRQNLAYINLSHAESFCLPPLEAFACGTPVVLTDTTGTRQYANDGQNCLVIPVGDTEATTAAVVKLLNSNALQKRLIQGGLRTAERYDWAVSEQHFVEYLTQLQ